MVAVKVLTPDATVADTTASLVVFRTTEGDMGVMKGHEACVAQLDTGLLRTYSDNELTNTFLVMGGFVTVQYDEVTVISELAEQPDKVESLLRAMEEKREETIRQEKIADAEIHKVEYALRQLNVSMDVSSYSIIKGRDEPQDAEWCGVVQSTGCGVVQSAVYRVQSAEWNCVFIHSALCTMHSALSWNKRKTSAIRG